MKVSSLLNKKMYVTHSFIHKLDSSCIQVNANHLMKRMCLICKLTQMNLNCTFYV